MIRRVVGVTVLLSASCLAGMPSGEVKVLGEIVPSRCEVIAPNNGVYDFGKIDLSDSSTALPTITQSWQVKCDSATYMEVIPEDNRGRATGDVGAEYFGLGGEGGETLGHYSLGVSNARIDQVAMPQIAGKQRSRNNMTTLIPGMRARWLMQNNVTRAGKMFFLDISVSPRLAMHKKAVTEAVSLDGSVTLNFVFGI